MRESSARWLRLVWIAVLVACWVSIGAAELALHQGGRLHARPFTSSAAWLAVSGVVCLLAATAGACVPVDFKQPSPVSARRRLRFACAVVIGTVLVLAPAVALTPAVRSSGGPPDAGVVSLARALSTALGVGLVLAFALAVLRGRAKAVVAWPLATLVAGLLVTLVIEGADFQAHYLEQIRGGSSIAQAAESSLTSRGHTWEFLGEYADGGVFHLSLMVVIAVEVNGAEVLNRMVVNLVAVCGAMFLYRLAATQQGLLDEGDLRRSFWILVAVFCGIAIPAMTGLARRASLRHPIAVWRRRRARVRMQTQ